MTYHVNNPFTSALTRSVAGGVSFIGRKYNREAIENKLLHSEGLRGSLAIIGLPDVGKRCLVKKVLLERRTELHRRKLVPIEMDLKMYTEPNQADKFFRDLVSSCWNELEDLDVAMPKIRDVARQVLEEWDKQGSSIAPLRRFFKHVLRADIRVIFILDNFDHADSLFKGDAARIHWLRQLTEADFQVTWVVLACKPIREIETVPNSLSDDMFDERRLGMFVEDDVKTYFLSLAQAGVSLSEEQKKKIIAYCGRHPYLLSLLGYYLADEYAYQCGTVDVERTFHKAEVRFNQSYDRIIKLVLDSDNRLQKLQQILSGQMVDVEPKDIHRMLAYDLIRPNPAYSKENALPAYIAFSEHFQHYLRTGQSSPDVSVPLLGADQQAVKSGVFGQTEVIPYIPEQGVKIFISYSREDEGMRKDLVKHLSNLKRQNLTTNWHDGEITAGHVWGEEINAHLNTASIILLLISPDFMNSDYCYEEMMRAMERHKARVACVIPIILRPTDWEQAPFEKLQVLPAGAKPITVWTNHDEAYVSVAKGIQKVIDEWTKSLS